MEEELLRKTMGNYDYFKYKYKKWFDNTKSIQERRIIKREVFHNGLLKEQQKELIWKYITKDLLK